MTAVNVKGVNYTKYDAEQGNWVEQGKIFSDLKVCSDTYEASAVDANSTIKMANLPNGAVIHGMTLAFDDLGTGCTLSVGDSTTANRYFSAVDVASAAGATSAILVDGLGYVIGTNAGDNDIIITTAGAAITGTVKLTVFYA